MPAERQQLIRALFDEYIEMYASRDDRLTTRFSENFSGYAGSSDTLVKNKDEWIKITRRDFAQVPERIHIEMLDLALQDLSEDVVAVTAFFHIHLPIPEDYLSRQAARLVLVFRREGAAWMIAHSGISVPFGLAEEGEVYPVKSMQQRNLELEALVEARTSELGDVNRRLEVLSNTDGLTGIANRRKFDHTLALEWNRAQRSGTSLALILIDVDYFKQFNDYYGHLAGDDCLKRLAKVFTQMGRRAGELVARFGGEEFVFLLPDTSQQDAMKSAQHIQQAIWSLAVPHAEAAANIITVSLGVASLIPSSQYQPNHLVNKADAALYRAKHAGRNCLQTAIDECELALSEGQTQEPA